MSDIEQPDAANEPKPADLSKTEGSSEPGSTMRPTEGTTDDAKPSEPASISNPDTEQKLAAAERQADKYARELFTARIAATGRLADPTDMPFSAELLDDADALSSALDALLKAKPHLASRKPAWGDIGAGQAAPSTGGPSFADLLGRR